MRDLGQEALDEMNRLLLNQQRLKMKLERMGDSQLADLSKKVHILNEANMKLEMSWGILLLNAKSQDREDLSLVMLARRRNLERPI